jgi:hypothetical protein
MLAAADLHWATVIDWRDRFRCGLGVPPRSRTSRLLKKSFAVGGEDGVVAVIEAELDFEGAIVL